MSGVQVLAIGEAMTMVRPLHAGPLEHAVEFRLDVGGAESNVASHLVRLGVGAAWAGAVGDDALGRRLLSTLRRHGVDVSLAVVDPHGHTGLYVKDPGSGVLYYRRGSAASRLDADFASTLPLPTVPWVHVSGITAAISAAGARLLERILTVRAAHGLPVSFDVNHRPALWESDASDALLDLARRCDLVFVGRDEAELLWGAMQPSELGDLILGRRPSGTRLVVKDGADGATTMIAGASRTWFAPTPPAEVVEAIGAGDGFAAGYLAAHIGGADPVEAALQGHVSASAALASTADVAEGV